MSFGAQKTIVLTKDELKDLESYCALNKFNVDEIIKSSFKQGFSIEKYGLLGKTVNEGEKHLIKEVIVEKRVEIPVEVIKEVVKIEYVEVPVEVIKEVTVEKLVEVIKEVPVDKVVIKEIIKEVPVEKIVTIYDNSSENELLLKIQQLETQMSNKDENLDELRRNLDIALDKPPVEIEKIIEIEKIVEVEKVVEVEVEKSNDKSKLLEVTLQNLRKELTLKNETIKELENKNKQLESFNVDRGAVYMKGSNITQNI